MHNLLETHIFHVGNWMGRIMYSIWIQRCWIIFPACSRHSLERNCKVDANATGPRDLVTTTTNRAERKLIIRPPDNKWTRKAKRSYLFQLPDQNTGVCIKLPPGGRNRIKLLCKQIKKWKKGRKGSKDGREGKNAESKNWECKIVVRKSLIFFTNVGKNIKPFLSHFSLPFPVHVAICSSLPFSPLPLPFLVPSLFFPSFPPWFSSHLFRPSFLFLYYFLSV